VTSPRFHIGLGLAALALCLIWATPVDAARRSLKYGFPQDKIETFTFAISRTTSTEVEHLPAEAEGFDVGSLTSRIGAVETTIEGRIERVLARVFRDFSNGLVTRLVDVSGTISRGGETAPLSTEVLEGKSVSFRMLPSGELLDALGWDQLAGAGRGGSQVSELLLQSIMRLPRDIPRPGEMVPTTYRLRVRLDPFAGRDQTWVVAFESATPPSGCRRCVAISYKATIRETALDKHPARPMTVAGTATVSGSLLLARGTRNLLDHSFVFDWIRTVESQRANGTLRGRIKQLEHVEGRITAAAGK
jgi:hypothetical protein